MKYILLLTISSMFIGCAADGSFDAAGFSKAAITVSEVYQQTQRPSVVGYDAAGQPVYQ